MQSAKLIAACALLALLAVPLSAAASSNNHVCGLDATLNRGRTLFATISIDPLVLIEDAVVKSKVIFYDTRGAGFYDLLKKTKDPKAKTGGRVLVADGSWSDADKDGKRFVELRVLNGPLKDHTLLLFPVVVVKGKVSGSWYDADDPKLSGSLIASTDC